jgi:hypothetical protein
MKLQLTRPTGSGNLITGYGDNHVLVNGARHDASLVVTAEAVLPWEAATFEALAQATALSGGGADRAAGAGRNRARGDGFARRLPHLQRAAR